MENIRISKGHAGGNIKVIGIEANKVLLEQEIRDTSEWWFYWKFSAETAMLGEVQFQFCNGEVLGPWGPAISYDFINWSWLGSDSLINKNAFKYVFKEEGMRVYFCFSIPYQVCDYSRFMSLYNEDQRVKNKVLTQTEKGRSCPITIMSNEKVKKNKRDIVFTARHHACESTASYVLEGLLEEILDSDSEILDYYNIHVIPFIDIDGVEDGDQGKFRIPYDHNRDYDHKPIYSTTKAIRNYTMGLEAEVLIDLHSPWKWGGRNDWPFFIQMYSPIKEEIDKLGELLQEETKNNIIKDKIIYYKRNDIQAGEDWNLSKPYTCTAFFERQGAKLSAGLEIPYFGTNDSMVTQKTLRQMGRDIKRALDKYLDIRG